VAEKLQALLSLHCGLRAGEIFKLRGRDLDFENGLIRIMDPKNRANRTAFMTEAVKEMLKVRLQLLLRREFAILTKL
jgi:integrase